MCVLKERKKEMELVSYNQGREKRQDTECGLEKRDEETDGESWWQ